MLVARTGWSGEVGYEIFLRDGARGSWLWDRLFEAGRPFDVMAGAPNNIRRMEAGFLSWGSDMDWNMNPYEMGLDKFVDLEKDENFIGKGALTEIAASGPARRLIGLFIDGAPIRQGPVRWWPVTEDGHEVGLVTSATWTLGMEQNIAFAILEVGYSVGERDVAVQTADGDRTAKTTAIPFVDPRYRD